MGRLLDFLRGGPDPLADYEFEEMIAEGGMGRVWKVRHRPTDGIYAVKIMSPETRETREKFREIWAADEGQIALQLKHPNVVETLDYGQTGDSYYVLMEYIDGQNVTQLLRCRPGYVRQHRFDIVVQSGRGLRYLHTCDLVHRDFCPKNVLVDSRNRSRLIDFGLTIPAARRPDSQVDMSGTASYMAPEQIRRTGVDARSDIYAFGVSAFEILTGERPFPAAASRDEKLSKHLNVEPRSLSEVEDELPAELEDIVGKCMEKQPDRRYNSMDEVLRDLVAVVRKAKNT